MEAVRFIVGCLKILAAILPPLAKRGKLTGRWYAEYEAEKTREVCRETVKATQLFSVVWGTISPQRGVDPEWRFHGLIRDQVFVGIYWAAERLRHWQGSFTLVFQKSGELSGVYSGFEEETQSLVSSRYDWQKAQ